MVTAFQWFRLLSKLYKSLKLLSEVSAEGQTRPIEIIRQPELQANISDASIEQVRWFWITLPAELLFPEHIESAEQPVTSSTISIRLPVTI
jgi:hypothetical protein